MNTRCNACSQCTSLREALASSWQWEVRLIDHIIETHRCHLAHLIQVNQQLATMANAPGVEAA